MGRKGIDLRDARQVGHDGRTHGAPGAHQIAVLQRVLHQLLRRHVDNVVVAADNIAQLGLHPLGNALRRVLAIQPVQLAVDQRFQILHGVFNFGCEKIVGHRTHPLAHIGDQVGVGHHHLIGLFLPEIGKFLQHLVGGAEIQGVGAVAVLIALGCQQDMAEDLVLRVEKMNVPRGHHGLAQFLAQLHHRAVEAAQLLLVGGDALGQHKAVVAQGLDLQKIVEGGDTPQFGAAFVSGDGLKQLPRLAGAADDQSLAPLYQLGLGNPGHPLVIFQIAVGDKPVQVAQAGGIFGKKNDMPCVAVVDPASGTQLGHVVVNGLNGADAPLGQHFGKALIQKAAGHGVVRRPVVVKLRQTQIVRHQIELVLAQLGQQIL